MPLTLVLGPANSAKAGEVLGAFGAAAHRGALLVVPNASDAEHYSRELAEQGSVLASVLTFSGLIEEIARRAGYAERRLTALQRERVLERAVGRARLRALAQSAEGGGFAPRRGGADRRARALAGQPRAVRAGDAPVGCRGPAARAVRAGRVGDLPGLRPRARAARPGRRRAVRVAGARRAAARPGAVGKRARLPLRVRRPAPARARRGRDAVPGRRRRGDGVADLRGGAARAARPRRGSSRSCGRSPSECVELPALDDYYEPASRVALHHLERSLFEPTPDPVDRSGPRGAPAGGRGRARRGRAGRRGGASGCCAPACRPRRSRSSTARSTRSGPLFAHVLERYGVPAALRASGSVRAHGARARAAGARPLRAAAERRGLGRGPARLPARARAARAPGAWPTRSSWRSAARA